MQRWMKRRARTWHYAAAAVGVMIGVVITEIITR